MNRRFGLYAAYLALAAMTGSTGALAQDIPCSCRANGQLYQMGQTACLRVGGSNRLARCEKVLNITSWTMLSGDCPTAQQMTPRDGTQIAMTWAEPDATNPVTTRNPAPLPELR
jgi:hypothetical protein